MLQIARESEIELSVKIILAMVIGMFLSDAIGWTGSFTITYAMILMTYLNRGIGGMRLYYRKRMQCQLLMCILLFITVVPLQTYTELDSWVIFLITSVPVAVLMLWLYYKYSYTPIILTGVISPMIILSSAMKDGRYYSWRMVLTFLGLILGWGISLLYPFRNKVGRTEKSLKRIEGHTLKRLNVLLDGGNQAADPKEKKTREETAYEMEQIGSYMAVLKSDMDTVKYRPLKEQILRLSALLKETESLLAFTDFFERNAERIHRRDSAFYDLFIEETRYMAEAYARSLKGEVPSAEKASASDGNGLQRLYDHADTDREINALAALIRCRRAGDVR